MKITLLINSSIKEGKMLSAYVHLWTLDPLSQAEHGSKLINFVCVNVAVCMCAFLSQRRNGRRSIPSWRPLGTVLLPWIPTPAASLRSSLWTLTRLVRWRLPPFRYHLSYMLNAHTLVLLCCSNNNLMFCLLCPAVYGSCRRCCWKS